MRKELYLVGALAILIGGGLAHKIIEDSSVSASETSLKGPSYQVTRGNSNNSLIIETYPSWAVFHLRQESRWAAEAINRVQESCQQPLTITSINSKIFIRPGLVIEGSVPDVERCFRANTVDYR